MMKYELFLYLYIYIGIYVQWVTTVDNVLILKCVFKIVISELIWTFEITFTSVRRPWFMKQSVSRRKKNIAVDKSNHISQKYQWSWLLDNYPAIT